VIVFVASYPRSGSGLIRLILKRCFDLNSYDIYQPKNKPPHTREKRVDLFGYRSTKRSRKSPATTSHHHCHEINLVIDRRHGLEPFVVLELADRLAVESDRQPQADRRRVDEHAARHERGVDASQGVDHALRLDTSERPAAERDVKGLSLDVEHLHPVYAESNALRVGRRPRLLHPLGIRIERVNVRGPCRRESCEPTFATADVEDPGALERDERLDPSLLDPVQVGDVH